jgi:3-isopropylmalate dehydrogenase
MISPDKIKLNPLASILSAALMLEIGFGLKEEASRLTDAVGQVLKQGFRTGDIASAATEGNKILGTKEMGKKVLELLN